MKIFSGVRPTGQFHLGNYLGALKNWINLQENHTGIFSIVDLHAITTPYDPQKLQEKIFSIAATYLSAGLDPDKATIFVQSKVKEHAELAWLLGTIAPVGELKRMTQYKTKSKKLKAGQINAGLLNYPLLMSADILLYQAEGVPIGEDQEQHLELARTLARKFNNEFGETFIIPEKIVPKVGARIKSLQDPEQKMSKSGSDNGNIYLNDDPAIIRKKVKKAVTDSENKIKYDPDNKAGLSNLITIYSIFTGKEIKEIEKEFSDSGYGEFKEVVAETIVDGLSSFQEEYKKLQNNPEKVEKILEEGRRKAQKIASKNILKIKKKMGLIT